MERGHRKDKKIVMVTGKIKKLSYFEIRHCFNFQLPPTQEGPKFT